MSHNRYLASCSGFSAVTQDETKVERLSVDEVMRADSKSHYCFQLVVRIYLNVGRSRWGMARGNSGVRKGQIKWRAVPLVFSPA